MVSALPGGERVELPLVMVVATGMGTIAALVAFIAYRRNEKARPAPAPARWHSAKAVVDPLGAMWTELNWLVTEDPWMDHTLTDIDRVIALVSRPDEPPIPSRVVPMSALDAIDIDAMMNELRARNRRTAPRRDDGPGDALQTYLRALGERTAPPNPDLLVLVRGR